MKKIILRNIYMGAAVALVLSAVLVFALQVGLQQSSARDTADYRIMGAKNKLTNAENQITELYETLNEGYLSSAHSFAEMITLNPAILDDADELERIRVMLGVDELHVTDENGIILWSTVPAYLGFDFNSSEQTKPFLSLINNSSSELAQDPQPNGAEGKLFQYIGVSRKDAAGIVQVGLEPERLSNAIADNQIDVVLSTITVGNSGSMFAVAKSDNTIAAFYDDSLIGTDASEVGFTEKLLTMEEGKGKTVRINGSLFYVCTSETTNYYIGTLIPSSEIMGQTVLVTVITVVFIAVVIVLLSWIVSRAVNVHIIAPINEIGSDMEKIKAGDTELRVNVRSCDEFSVLSDGINGMLDSIDAKMSETNRLNGSMENLLIQIKDISGSINSYANEMEDVSRKISDGSSSQAATVEELSAAFANISRDVNENAQSARNAAEITVATGEHLKLSAEKLKQMQDSMDRISEASNKIGNIVNTIDDIAFQTNILALNAAVEAASAGQHGKGFAVVADEVRNLANKSAEAAQGTTALIAETLEAVKQGAQVADAAAEELSAMLESMDKNTALIEEISNATSKQANAISEASSGMNLISDVVQTNSAISFSAQDTAKKLDAEAGRLMQMVTRK
ncbi:MAG: methyl-accepting chemotaxis protein [Oscillospiraceae bacterium]